MRQDITIVAAPRTGRGKNEARRLRVAGRIPAIIYGSGSKATAVAVDPRQIDRLMFSSSGHNTVFNVQVEGLETTPVMLVDWQHDPVTDTLLHVDLARIDLAKKLSVKVPVRTLGDPLGVKQQGGFLEIVHREIEVRCLPEMIPESIETDVTGMMIGDTLRASDLQLGEEVELLGKSSMVICNVVAMRAAEEEEKSAEEEGEEGAGGGEEAPE